MNLSALHDSHLIGLSIDKAKWGQRLFELAGGGRVSLVLEGVEHLKADDFKEGNIVLEVVVRVLRNMMSTTWSSCSGENIWNKIRF